MKPFLKKVFLKDALVFTVFFLLVLWLDTRLVYMVTAPNFRVQRDFFIEALSRLGGLAEISSSLLGQLLFFRVAGALGLTALAMVLLYLSKRTVQLLDGDPTSNVSYIPLFVFTAMVSTYYFALEGAFATTFLFFMAIVWMSCERWPIPVRAGALTLMSALLYFATVGNPEVLRVPPLGLFPLKVHALLIPTTWMFFCVYFELYSDRLSAVGISKRLAWLIPATMVGPLLIEYSSENPLSPAQLPLRMLPFWQVVLSLAMYTSAGLVILSLFIRRVWPAVSPRAANGEAKEGQIRKSVRPLYQNVSPFVFLGAAAVLSWWAPQRGVMPSDILGRILKVSHLVRNEQYEQAVVQADRTIECIEPWQYTRTLQLDVNLALHKTGLLLDEIFHWPQPIPGILPLFSLHTRLRTSVCAYERKTDTAIRLGRINDAEHMAYEMMAVTCRYRPDLFWHLARIHMVKNEPKMARIYLNNLAADLIHRPAAVRYLNMLDRNPSLSGSAEISRLRARMLLQDDVQDIEVGSMRREKNMVNLLERDPSNRLALDYLIGSLLRLAASDEIVSHAHRLLAAGYVEIPSRVQEAILAHKDQGAELPEEVCQRISPKIKASFEEFRAWEDEWYQTRDIKSRTRLEAYAGTYWFHLFSVSSGENMVHQLDF